MLVKLSLDSCHMFDSYISVHIGYEDVCYIPQKHDQRKKIKWQYIVQR